MKRLIWLAMCCFFAAAPVTNSVLALHPDESLQEAVRGAPKGTTIVLADGVYPGGVDFAGESGITVVAERYGRAILAGGQVRGGDHITLKGLVVQKVVTQLQNAAVVMGPDWRLEDCIVRDNESVGVAIGPRCYLLRVQSVDNGYLGYGCGGKVVFDGPTLKDCISARNNTGRTNPIWKSSLHAISKDGKWFVDPAWEAGGGKFCLADGLVIDGMKSYDNVGPGIWLDCYDRAATIRNCEVYGNKGLVYWQGAGIAVEISDGPTLIENNYCHDNTGDNLAIWESMKVTARKNVFVGTGIVLRGMDRGAYRCEDVLLEDNELYGPGADVSYWENLTPEIRGQRRLVEQGNRVGLSGAPRRNPAATTDISK